MAAGHRIEPGRWQAAQQELLARVASRFARVETRRRFAGFLSGMLAELPRKNCWTIAEHAGDSSPHGMQHLLNKAVWDTGAVAADLREYVIEHLGEADGVLVADETGDLKKGERTVGVRRQYTGTAGRIENAQVAVYLTYTARSGHAMIDPGGEGLTGLDEHQVRRWTSWRRWTLIAMLSHALLAVLAATERTRGPAPAGLIPLTCNEIARLLNRLVLDPARRLADTLTWTHWRRRHQHRARTSHYRTRPET